MGLFSKTPEWRVVVEGYKNGSGMAAVETHVFVVPGKSNAEVRENAERACRAHGHEPVRIVKILELTDEQ